MCFTQVESALGSIADRALTHSAPTSGPSNEGNSRWEQSTTIIRPFHIDVPELGVGRASQTHSGDTVARPGNRDGHIARRAARDDAETRALLGDGLRLAQMRSETERPAAFHHRDRRARHSFHSRPFETRECAAAHRYARMARLDHRAAEDHRPADRSHGTWRERIGRVRPRDPVDAGLRILGQADHAPAGIPSASRAPGSC